MKVEMYFDKGIPHQKDKVYLSRYISGTGYRTFVNHRIIEVSEYCNIINRMKRLVAKHSDIEFEFHCYNFQQKPIY